mgnify:CR=1 FL=1
MPALLLTIVLTMKIYNSGKIHIIKQLFFLQKRTGNDADTDVYRSVTS